jgi:thiol-disulfide isomerase/thioredoxin
MTSSHRGALGCVLISLSRLLRFISPHYPYPTTNTTTNITTTTRALLQANQDKLIVLKIFAPWCAECKRIDPHLKKLKKNTTPEPNSRLLSSSSSSSSTSAILWADLALGPDNKDHVHSIGVEGIPTIQFYVHGGLEDTFSCGLSSIPLLNEKIVHYMDQYIILPNVHHDDDDITTTTTTQSLKKARRDDALAATKRLASIFADRTPPEWLFR